jgi:hypothetical protein
MSLAGNQTILTEASFAITQDRLVQVITQVYPYEPRWDKLQEIDLSGFGLESVTKLKELLPSLVMLKLYVGHSYLCSTLPSLDASTNPLLDTIIDSRT